MLRDQSCSCVENMHIRYLHIHINMIKDRVIWYCDWGVMTGVLSCAVWFHWLRSFFEFPGSGSGHCFPHMPFETQVIYVKCPPRPLICSGVGPLTLHHGMKQCKTVTEQKHPVWDNGGGGYPFSAEVGMLIPRYRSTCRRRKEPMHHQRDNSTSLVVFCCILWAHSLIMSSLLLFALSFRSPPEGGHSVGLRF